MNCTHWVLPLVSILLGASSALGAGAEVVLTNGDTIDAPALYSSEDSDRAFITDRFLDRMEGIKVVPWVGGVLDVDCSPFALRLNEFQIPVSAAITPRATGSAWAGLKER